MFDLFFRRQDDLPILVGDALSPTYPFFLGYNFFEQRP